MTVPARRRTTRSSANTITVTATKVAKVSKKLKHATTRTGTDSQPLPGPDVSINGPWYRIFTKGDEEYDKYMATEWGFEKRGDVALFEKLSLEGAQSGLSWLTILRKRQAYRRVFFNFDIDKVAKMKPADVDRMLLEQDKDTRNIIVRHRGKIESVINNAQRIQEMKNETRGSASSSSSSFDSFLWSFVNNQPILNRWKFSNGKLEDVPSQSAESQAMSKQLKNLGFRFVGPTTCYSMMQSVGMVIDHPVDSPEWKAAKTRLQNRSGGYQER